MRRTIARLTLVAYTLFMLAITLLILGGKAATLNLIPFRMMVHDWRIGGTPLVVNFLGNIVAFLPLGALLPMVRQSRTRLRDVALIAAGFSMAIETMQYLFARRNADVDDVLLNTLGALFGYGLLRAIERLSTIQGRAEVAQSSSKTA